MNAFRLLPILLILLLAAPVLAQPTPDGARAVHELRVSLRLEAITRVVDSIAARLEKNDAAKAELVAGKRNASEAFAKRHLNTDV